MTFLQKKDVYIYDSSRYPIYIYKQQKKEEIVTTLNPILKLPPLRYHTQCRKPSRLLYPSLLQQNDLGTSKAVPVTDSEIRVRLRIEPIPETKGRIITERQAINAACTLSQNIGRLKRTICGTTKISQITWICKSFSCVTSAQSCSPKRQKKYRPKRDHRPFVSASSIASRQEQRVDERTKQMRC